MKSAAVTIEYEFRMLIVGVLAMDRAPTQEEKNLVLEALLLHARILRDFFATSGNPDDILARDFVRQMPRVAMPYLRSRKSRNRLNRLLAHASYSRRRLSKDWDVRTIVQELSGAMRTFLSHLRGEYPRRVAWFGVLDNIVSDAGQSES